MIKLLSSLFAMMLMVISVQAQSVDDLLKPVTGTYALKNVTIVQKPGQVIQNGTVIIKDGLIHAVGTNVTVPAGAEVLETDSMFVYAGFIDALSHVGVPAPKPAATQGGGGRGRVRIPGVDAGNPPPALAGVAPHTNAADKVSLEDKEIAAFRKLGFTTVHTVPRGQMLPGKGALVVLAGESAEEMVLKQDVSMFAQLSTARGVFPNTVMGVMSKYRELYVQAQQLEMHHKAYKKNMQSMTRPERDQELEALFPVINGELPVFFMTSGVKDLYRVMNLQSELGFKVVLAGVEQGWHVADKIKSGNTPILLTMDLPKEMKKAKKDDKAKEEKKDAEVVALEKRKKEAYDEHEAQAATMAKAGIAFGFTSMGTKSGDVKKNLQRMMKAGLEDSQALAALTTTPAAMFGVDNVMGTVEKGKIANLVISDKPYFDEKSNVRMVIADGHVFKYAAPKKRPAGAANGAKPAKVDGAWSYSIDSPMGKRSGTLTLTMVDGDVSGEISDEEAGGTDIQNAELEGNVLMFSMPFDMGGQSATLEYELTFEGDAFEGTVSVGEFGSFEIQGTKKPQ